MADDANVSGMVRKALRATRYSLTEVATKIGMSPQALSYKLGHDTLRPAELDKIAGVIGVDFICSFRLPDGAEIKWDGE